MKSSLVRGTAATIIIGSIGVLRAIVGKKAPNRADMAAIVVILLILLVVFFPQAQKIARLIGCRVAGILASLSKRARVALLCLLLASVGVGSVVVCRQGEPFSFARSVLEVQLDTLGSVENIQLLLRRNDGRSMGDARYPDASGNAIFSDLRKGTYRLIAIERISATEANGCFRDVTLEGGRRLSTWPLRMRKIPIRAFDAAGFAVGSWDLNHVQIQSLNTVVQQIQPVGHWVLVLGCCDATGGDEINDTLGGNRSKEAQKYFAGQGVHKERLRLYSCGKRNLLVRGQFESVPANRRVECLILPQGLGNYEPP